MNKMGEEIAKELFGKPLDINGIPKKLGDIWERCECGKEPVYLPLFLCSDCWPKK